jgi:hypothetical protein
MLLAMGQLVRENSGLSIRFDLSRLFVNPAFVTSWEVQQAGVSEFALQASFVLVSLREVSLPHAMGLAG